jgi:hypothetical protein
VSVYRLLALDVDGTVAGRDRRAWAIDRYILGATSTRP